MAFDTTGTEQVGSVNFPPSIYDHACLWHGTAASFVDLHPPGASSSSARGTDGTTQGGVVDNHAGIWTGSAASWVDLHPPGASASEVRDLVPGQQVGFATIGGQYHAAMWGGSASTFADLHPASAVSSLLLGTTGVWQGGVWTTAGGYVRAGIWKGTAATFQDLHAVLGGAFTDSQCTSIAESGGAIVAGGWAWNSPGPPLHAVIWALPAFALTATTTGGGVGDLTLGIAGVRPTATNVLLLVSGTPAPGGPGTGQFFGLFFPDPILFSVLATPSASFSLLHFPVTANPYAAGPLFFGPGSLSWLVGQVWDTTAICYGPADGISGQTFVQRLIW
jgi:hypothetical protein